MLRKDNGLHIGRFNLLCRLCDLIIGTFFITEHTPRASACDIGTKKSKTPEQAATQRDRQQSKSRV